MHGRLYAHFFSQGHNGMQDVKVKINDACMSYTKGRVLGL